MDLETAKEIILDHAKIHAIALLKSLVMNPILISILGRLKTLFAVIASLFT
jgi:hypothetical protein